MARGPLASSGTSDKYDSIPMAKFVDVAAAAFEAAADAATDSVPPGLGGFMHGMYTGKPTDS